MMPSPNPRSCLGGRGGERGQKKFSKKTLQAQGVALICPRYEQHDKQKRSDSIQLTTRYCRGGQDECPS